MTLKGIGKMKLGGKRRHERFALIPISENHKKLRVTENREYASTPESESTCVSEFLKEIWRELAQNRTVPFQTTGTSFYHWMGSRGAALQQGVLLWYNSHSRREERNKVDVAEMHSVFEVCVG